MNVGTTIGGRGPTLAGAGAGSRCLAVHSSSKDAVLTGPKPQRFAVADGQLSEVRMCIM